MSVLRQIHDDLDAAVPEAYGWRACRRHLVLERASVSRVQWGPCDLKWDIFRAGSRWSCSRSEERGQKLKNGVRILSVKNGVGSRSLQ